MVTYASYVAVPCRNLSIIPSRISIMSLRSKCCIPELSLRAGLKRAV